MTAQIIDGKALAKIITEKVKEDVSKLGNKPGLAIIMVGNNPASEVYVGKKQKKAESLGFNFELHHLKEDANESDVLQLIDKLNQNPKILIHHSVYFEYFHACNNHLN